MNTNKFIPLKQLCTHYKVEIKFFINLSELGLIEIKTIERTRYIHEDKITAIEKILRLHHDLDVNIEGIDIIFQLLQKLETKETELNKLRNRLQFYEH